MITATKTASPSLVPRRAQALSRSRAALSARELSEPAPSVCGIGTPVAASRTMRLMERLPPNERGKAPVLL